MQPITKDNCDFPTLRQSGCVYVDKTAWFHRLATDPQASFFFLARPRRFGKSLMISTLKAMFQGRKDLFEGLAIMDTGWDWEKEKRPVIHLNMGMCAAADYETFAANLPCVVKDALAGAGVEYNCHETPSRNFGAAIDTLSAKEKTIVGLRYGLGNDKEHTQKEVADMMGISQSYISRLEKRIIGKLREELQKMA